MQASSKISMWRPLATSLLAAGLIFSAAARADEVKQKGEKHEGFDTEHIFGFTEGADIGEKGEIEAESGTVGAFGRSAGRYTSIDSETALRYVVVEGFRASVGAHYDYDNFHDVPGLPDRNAFNVAGLATELRWHPVERSSASPVGMTLSLTPEWRRINEGAISESYAVTAELLLDAEIIPGKFFTAFNLAYEPSVTRGEGAWEHEDALEIGLAAAFALTDNLVVGGEIRHLSSGDRGPFAAQALYVGPSVYYRFTKDFSLKFAWSEQIPSETGHLDLVNFERHQALLLLVKGF
jgi:hypothetical protein